MDREGTGEDATYTRLQRPINGRWHGLRRGLNIVGGGASLIWLPGASNWDGRFRAVGSQIGEWRGSARRRK